MFKKFGYSKYLLVVSEAQCTLKPLLYGQPYNVTIAQKNKKAFERDAYHPLRNRTSFNHQDVGTGGGCPRVNKFEQVSSDSHQISLVRGQAGGGVRSNASWVIVIWAPPPACEQTDTSENITFPILYWREVTIERT